MLCEGLFIWNSQTQDLTFLCLGVPIHDVFLYKLYNFIITCKNQNINVIQMGSNENRKVSTVFQKLPCHILQTTYVVRIFLVKLGH